MKMGKLYRMAILSISTGRISVIILHSLGSGHISVIISTSCGSISVIIDHSLGNDHSLMEREPVGTGRSCPLPDGQSSSLGHQQCRRTHTAMHCTALQCFGARKAPIEIARMLLLVILS